MNMRTPNETALWRSACRLARALGMREWRNLLVPVDYVRTRELPEVLDMIRFGDLPVNCRVLDIASPQLLSVHLATVHPGWGITYLNSFRPELDQMQRWTSATGITGVQSLEADARDPGLFSPGSFDLILCSSVLEHIAEFEGRMGDAQVMSNMARWLAPGGQVVISVPFSRRGFDEFADGPIYGDQAAANGRFFFQRFYDEISLKMRLLDSSALRPEAKSFLGERYYHEDDPHRRLAIALAQTRWRYVLGRLYPLLTHCFLERSNSPAKLRKPYIAIIRLVKL